MALCILFCMHDLPYRASWFADVLYAEQDVLRAYRVLLEQAEPEREAFLAGLRGACMVEP
jgi:hypothetical protein